MKKLDESSPLFITYSAHPSDSNPQSHIMTKHDLARHFDPSYFLPGFENGQIVCTLVPIDCKYIDPEESVPVFGEVSPESLAALLRLKSDVAQGRAACPPKRMSPRIPSDLPEYISLEMLAKVLIAKGYDSKGTQGWDAKGRTYFVADPKNVQPGSSGGLYPVCPINNPVWGHEKDYEPMFCSAQVLALPDCEVTSGVPLSCCR